MLVTVNYMAGYKSILNTDLLHSMINIHEDNIPRRENSLKISNCHYNDVIMSAMTSQITSHTIVYSTVYSGADQRKHQSSASLAFVMGIHRWPVNSPYKGPVTRKMFPFDDVNMVISHSGQENAIRYNKAKFAEVFVAHRYHVMISFCDECFS